MPQSRAPRPGRSRRLGVPGVDALIDASDAEHAKLDDVMAVTSAESAVLSVRMAGLAATEKRARRRRSAAKGMVTRARKDGRASKIAAATANYDRVAAEADVVIGACLGQMHEIVQAGNASLGAVLDQAGRAWKAGAAVIEALAGPPGGNR